MKKMATEYKYYTNTFLVVNLTLIYYNENVRSGMLIKLIDPDGQDPGEPFESADAAAFDFALLYNDNSIEKGKEYGTVIVEIQKNDNTFYTYLKPTKGSEASVYAMGLGLSNEGDAKTVAKAHTHGQYLPGYKNNEFSEADIENGYHYVATPNGSLLKYDSGSKQTNILSTNIPSDPKDPSRLNIIDFKPLPKTEPTYNVWDFIKRNVIAPILIGSRSIKN
jgi:hypothetical protein